jgi:transcriptional regulator with XRE-family HTH domain
MLIFKHQGKYMSARGRGGGKTPEMVVELLREAVSKSSQAQVAKDTEQTRLTIQRYLKGIGEPSQATLDKLADYFGVTVARLRGERTIVRGNIFIPKIDEELSKMNMYQLQEVLNLCRKINGEIDQQQSKQTQQSTGFVSMPKDINEHP